MDPASTQTNRYIYIKMCVGIDLCYSECNACLDGERVNSIYEQIYYCNNARVTNEDHTA